MESGYKCVLRSNCLDELVMPVVDVVKSMFILSVFRFVLLAMAPPVLLLLFFSSDIFKYSAVLSSRQ